MATKGKAYVVPDTVLVDQLYPLIDAVMNGKINAYRQCIDRYFNSPLNNSAGEKSSRWIMLHDYAPIDRIYFNKKDETDFFRSLNIQKSNVDDILPDLYYWKKDELAACKDPFSLTLLMVMRWLLINKPNDDKLLELSYMYFAFSGKIYTSCHAKWFRNYIPKREIMDYVINYMLSAKFDLIKTGTVWGAIRNLTATWMNTYSSELKGNITDERISYIIHQLHSRIYAFLRNIAKPYYEAAEKKLYINKESDNYDSDNFHIASNNSTIAAQLTEKTVNYMINSQVDLKICQMVSGNGVNPYEIKSIFENILNTNDHLDELRFVINIMILDYMRNYPDDKDGVGGVNFIHQAMSLKPNTKDPDILKQKSIILEWLNTSERYKRIRTQTTKNSYFRAILAYIAFTVNTACK